MGKRSKRMINEIKSKGFKVIVPNAFTAFRLGASYKIIKAAINGDLKNTAIWATLGAVSDAFDGSSARKLDAGTEFGSKFDQIVDKVYAFSLIAPLLKEEPKWSLIVLSELAIAKTNLEKEAKGINVKSTTEGKLKTIMLFTTISLNYAIKTFNLNNSNIEKILNGMFGCSVIMELITLSSYLDKDDSKSLKKSL